MSTSVERTRTSDRGRHWPVAVLMACLTLTIAGASTTRVLYRDSERQLLDQQTREAAAVLTAAIGETETGLANLALVAGNIDSTGGGESLMTALADQVIAESGFVSIALVRADGQVVTTAGEDPLAAKAAPERFAELLTGAAARPGEIHTELVTGPSPDRLRRIGYATTVGGGAATVYAESPLPERSTGVGRSDGPFSDIDYAIHLVPAGDDRRELLYTSADQPTLDGQPSSVTLPFADAQLVFEAAAAEPLSGGFAQSAPWFLLAGGLLVSVLAGLASRSIIRRRQRAEQLAAEISDLYDQQRAGIDTLRRSLLPRRLSAPPGTTIETGYWPADSDHEVSGDFYDAFRVDDDRWALVIGDVCGKGAEAAALTALTRHTIRAAARHLRSPNDVLRWTHEAIAAHGASTYVTVCFAFVEPRADGTARVSFALGGHPRPALWRDGSATMVGSEGTLLGLIEPQLETTEIEVRPGDVLVLYTDGLTDSADGPLTSDELADIIAASIAAPDPTTTRRADTAAAIREAVQRHRNGETDDDSAVLILNVVGADAADGAAVEPALGAMSVCGPR